MDEIEFHEAFSVGKQNIEIKVDEKRKATAVWYTYYNVHKFKTHTKTITCDLAPANRTFSI